MKERWVILDHLCRHCSGRILQCVAGGGPTGGGNPIFRCADCGKGGAAMGPDVVCWCGGLPGRNEWHQKGKYQCLPFSIVQDEPWMKQAFQCMGFDPDNGRGEVGIILTDKATIDIYKKRYENAKKSNPKLYV